MSLFLGPMQHHIPGHKGMTDQPDVRVLRPEKSVYIPLFGGVAKVEVVVEEGQHVDIGTKLADTTSGFAAPIYSSVSGTYKGLVKKPHSSMRPQPHMEIELSEEQKTIQSFKPIDWQNASREELVEFMKQTGIIGQGGAGFPTYAKYQGVNNIDTVVINAVECEPYITSGYKTGIDETDWLIKGCQIMKRMSGAGRVLIGIKENRKYLADRIENELKDKNISDIEVKLVPNVYPMGMERVLIRTLLKRSYDRLPAECGVIVNNSITAIYTAKAMELGTAIAKKYVTFSGEALEAPNNVIVPVGMEVSEILEQIGGIKPEYDQVRLLAGGPMMGPSMVNDKFVIDRAMGAVTVLPVKEYPTTTCMHCGRCSANCPVSLQPIRISLAMESGSLEEMEKRGAMQCVECGMCTYICPAKIQLTENIRRAKRMLKMKRK